jgi:hypothetical protein
MRNENCDDWRLQLDTWLLESREGILSEEDRRALNKFLLARPEARSYARQSLLNDVALAEQCRLERAEQLFGHERVVLPRRLPGIPAAPFFWKVAACIALLVCGVTVWAGIRSGRLPEETTSAGVAVLSRTLGTDWGRAVRRQGQVLEPGTLSLHGGLARIDFLSGASLVVEGPAEIEIRSAQEAFCRSGRVFAEVPAQAQGFRISSPMLSITDSATRFGLEVGADGGSELHALRDAIQIATAAGAHRVVPGTAVVAGAGGKLSLVPLAVAKFRTPEEIETVLERGFAQRYALWKSHIARPAPEDLLLHYTFEAPGESRLRNSGSLRTPESDGLIVGCQWTTGRWPGKPALDFKRVPDRVRIRVPGSFDAVTWLAWVRVDSLPNSFNALVLNAGYNLHWQINREGCFALGAPLGKRRERGQSPPLVTPDWFGQWIQLGSIFDGAAGKVTHFFNGIEVSESRVPPGLKLTLGDADIGNWVASQQRGASAVRNFNGRIDELLFFKRALAAHEVKKLFEMGDPSFVAPGSRVIPQTHQTAVPPGHPAEPLKTFSSQSTAKFP